MASPSVSAPGSAPLIVSGSSGSMLLRKLCAVFPHYRIVVRTPFIPGVNGSVEDVRAIGEFLKSIGDDLHYELLPYHRYGESKYGFLGMQVPMTKVAATEDEKAIHAELARYRARERATVPLSPAQGAPLLGRVLHHATAASGATDPAVRADGPAAGA